MARCANDALVETKESNWMSERLKLLRGKKFHKHEISGESFSNISLFCESFSEISAYFVL